MKISFECQRTPSVDWVQFCDTPNIIMGKNKFHQMQQKNLPTVKVTVCGHLKKKG